MDKFALLTLMKVFNIGAAEFKTFCEKLAYFDDQSQKYLLERVGDNLVEMDEAIFGADLNGALIMVLADLANELIEDETGISDAVSYNVNYIDSSIWLERSGDSEAIREALEYVMHASESSPLNRQLVEYVLDICF